MARGEHDVQIAITHRGVRCADIQGIDDDYGITHCPFVPGHALIGDMSRMGSAVAGTSDGGSDRRGHTGSRLHEMCVELAR